MNAIHHGDTLVMKTLFLDSRLPWAVLRPALWSMLLMSGAPAMPASQPLDKPSAAEQKAMERNFELLPLRFEPNQGQSISDAKFIAQGRGFSALFKENGADFLFAGHTATSSPLRVRLLNASATAAVSAEKHLPGTVSYFIGSDREKWRAGLPTYERLRYTDVYPGTDLVYYGNGGRLEFDFELSPIAARADSNVLRGRAQPEN